MGKVYDALIVGAGPAGSHVAARLAALGHKVLVLEEHLRAGEAVCCTGIVGKECLDTFSVGAQVILREARSATLFSPWGRSLRVERETVQAYVVDRALFDSSLSAKAQKAGAEHLWGSIVKDILVDGESVKVETQNGGEIIEGRAAVIAAGFHSHLAERVGLGRIRNFAVGAQVEVKAKQVEEVVVYTGHKIAPGFFAWVVPSFPGMARVGLLAHRRPGEYLKVFLSKLAEEGRIAPQDSKVVYGGVPLSPLPRTFGDRVLVVGDAAGQVKPTTAGGIYYGLLCAEIAAETLHQALSANDLRSATLAAYEKEWKKRLGSELRAGHRARWLFERLSDERIDRIFEVVESKNIHGKLLNSPEFSFVWHRSVMLRAFRLLGLRGFLQILRSW